MSGMHRNDGSGDGASAGGFDARRKERRDRYRARSRSRAASSDYQSLAASKSASVPADLFDEQVAYLREALPNYDIMGRLEHGGQGVVYMARQRAADRVVALKVLIDGPLATERQRERFEREIAVISRLRHPNIVSLHDCGVVGGRHYFTMDFVDGLQIDDYCVLNDLTPRDIVRLIIQIARAVQYAHLNGVIHRDLNPSNIQIDDSGEPHVFDFGLAKDLSADDADPMTHTGQIFGTLPYVSPEQAGGLDGRIDTRSDVYSLAVVLYELLTDMLPYPVAGEAHAVRNSIILTEPMPLRRAVAQSGADRALGTDAINRDLEAILAKALSKAKDERYQSAADFADDLERYLQGEQVTARALSTTYVLRKTLRRYRVPVAIASAFLIVIIGAGVAVTMAWFQSTRLLANARESQGHLAHLFEFTQDMLEHSVRPLAGGLAVSDELAKELETELPALQKLIASDETMQPLAARLHEQQGNLARAQAKSDDARNHYSELLTRSRALAAGEPDNFDYQDSIARAYGKLASVSDDPAPDYVRGIEYAEQTLAADPDRDMARYRVCDLRVAYAEYLRLRGESTPALEQLDRALTVVPKDLNPKSDVDWLRVAAHAKSARGEILRTIGNGRDGIASLEDALALRREIVNATRSNVFDRWDLLKSCVAMAYAKSNSGEREQALEYFREGVKQSRYLGEAEPKETRWIVSRFAAHYGLARLLPNNPASDTSDERHTNWIEANELATQIRDQDPTDMEQSIQVGYAMGLRGEAQTLAGDWPQALETYSELIELRTSILNSDPENLSRRIELAEAYDRVAVATRHAVSSADAIPQYERALELRRGITRDAPDNVMEWLNLALTQANMALAQIKVNTPESREAALELLDDAEQRLQELNSEQKLDGFHSLYDERMSLIRQVRGLLSATPAL